MRRLLHLLLVLLLAQAGMASAQTFPKYTGRVVDAANVLPPATRADLEAKLLALQKDTKRQLVVVTVPNLQGYDIETYGYKLGREWGVGLRDVNNGAVLLVAPKERRVRVEVGYGLEPVITDGLSSVVIAQDILPRFKAGDLPGGVVAGVDALDKQLRASPEEAKARTDAAIAAFDKEHRRAGRSGGGGVPVGLIFWGMVIGFVALSMLRRRSGTGRVYTGGDGGFSGGYGGSNLPIVMWGLGEAMSHRERGGGWGAGGDSWGGGGFGGDGNDGGGGSDGSWGGDGFSGGGGGSFGGGGASGSW